MKKKSSHFDKFTKKKSNAAIKEQFKQEKRKVKKEREEYFDKKKAEARGLRPDAGSRKPDITGQKGNTILHPRPDTAAISYKIMAHSHRYKPQG
ncbi:MAG: hypothetical protein WDO16_22425 [Bacteroidota bacterium]